jgi:hypothetical protein
MKTAGNAAEPVNESSRHWQRWLPVCVITILAVLAYANTLRMDFVYDDLLQIKEFPLIRDLRLIPRLFSGDMWQVMGGKAPYYRPLFYTTFSLDYFFWKENPFGYHLSNILLHVATSVLVYLLAKKLTASRIAACAAGALFAVHPVHTETVAWVSARCDSLAAVFMLLSYIAFISFLENRRKAVLAGSLLAFFTALIAKEMAITLPLIIFVHVWCFCDGSWKKRIVWPALFCATVLPYLIIRALALDIQSWGSVPLLWKFATGVGLIVSYTRLLLFPANLRVFYNIPIQKQVMTPEVLVPLVLLLAIVAAVVVVRKYDRQLFLSLSWLYITILPVSGLLTFINPALMAERYLYIPSVGFCMAAGILFARLVSVDNQLFRRAAGMAGAGALVTLLLLTTRHNSGWADQHIFMEHMVRDAAGTEYGSYFQATLYKESGRTAMAIAEYNKTLALNSGMFEAHYNLGILYAGMGLPAEAEKAFRRTLELSPRFVKAYNNLGVVYAMQGKMSDAMTQFDKALRFDPNDVFARENFDKAAELLR